MEALLLEIQRLCTTWLNAASRARLQKALEELNNARDESIDSRLASLCRKENVCYICLEDILRPCATCASPLCEACHHRIFSAASAGDNECRPRVTWAELGLMGGPSSLPPMMQSNFGRSIVMAAVHRRTLIGSVTEDDITLKDRLVDFGKFWHPLVAYKGMPGNVRVAMLAILRGDIVDIIHRWNTMYGMSNAEVFGKLVARGGNRIGGEAMDLSLLRLLSAWFLKKGQLRQISTDESVCWLQVHNMWLPLQSNERCEMNEVVGRYCFDKEKFFGRIFQSYERLYEEMEPDTSSSDDDEDEDEEGVDVDENMNMNI